LALLTVLCALPGLALANEKPLETSAPFELQTPSYLLMEAKTGQVILEKNADVERPVASVTKLMSILLVLEALENGHIRLSDKVLSSPNASGMGGSQALLDANVTYPLETLLKSMIVASANDSAVALAEYVSGSEDAFVRRMNARAQELGMTHTRYVNCTGLPAEGQYTTARDVAMVSRAVGAHPTFFTYSTVWMDKLTHPSGRVTDLTNTNRLIRFYEGADGFKTGSTNEARYCISATAARGSTRMIAVVLGTPASQVRFDEARKLMEYGFANYQLSQVAKEGDLIGLSVPVRFGGQKAVPVAVGEEVALLLTKGVDRDLRIEAVLEDSVAAPVAQGAQLGELRVMLGDEVLRTVPAVAAIPVGLPGYLEALIRILNRWKI
jgi:D-alanyl-D-alanine carboxypeptidase (penicillin-binding protein 5/6)